MAESDTNETKVRHIRINDEMWARMGEVAAVQGKTRASITVELWRWFLDDYGKPAMPHLAVPPRPEDE